MELPIIPRYHANVTRTQLECARELAASIRREQPALAKSEKQFRHLIVDTEIDDSPSLHLDDFSEIPCNETNDNSSYLQQRARLRATEGDFVAQSNRVESGFSDYCENQLGLGQISWLYPSSERSDSRKIAFDCIRDRRVKHDLIQAIRQQGLRYIHPYISTLLVWELADVLHKSSRLPIKVIGPTPALAAWANDKIEFAQATAQLLGPDSVPRTDFAYNMATLSDKVVKLAADHTHLGIKFPHATGGSGNFLVDTVQLKGKSLADIHCFLEGMLDGHHWPQGGRVLVDVWETDVVCSPSVQTWIPPSGVAEPVIEGLFRQSIQGNNGAFVGSCQLSLPKTLQQKIVDNSFLLTILLQELGYVGRCSFDLVLVGNSIDDCRVEYIESNARWGGTSIPMTLVNRLKLDNNNAFCVKKIEVPGLERLEFDQLIRGLHQELYDRHTGRGKFVLFDPGRIKATSSIDVIAIAGTSEQAEGLLTGALTDRLTKMVQHVPNHQNAPGGLNPNQP